MVKKFKFFIIWLVFAAALGAVGYYYFFEAEDKTPILPGTTTDGHYQIEMQCDACHTNEKQKNVFTSSGVPNSACTSCHGADLEEFSDSHPTRKFKNPENAIFTQHIDALQCVTCHTEHNHKITGDMGVTVPQDYCAHCHEVTLENLESHQNLPFNSCDTSGCHNYHDNVALAPSFLRKNFGQDDFKKDAKVKPVNALARWIADGNAPRDPLTIEQADAPAEKLTDNSINQDWAHTAHAAAGINCMDCHDPKGTGKWIPIPAHNECSTCHETEFGDFKKGKHGMRLAHEGLGPMTPDMARLPMRESAKHKALDCNSCHKPHQYDRQYAAYKACTQCHNDEHTKSYANSAHARLWQAEVAGTAAVGTGVSCATCHMPHEEREDGKIVVNHNQNANLTPGDKMLRNVCMDCHGMQFSMNALMDEQLIKNNFIGRPTQHHEGIDWAVESAVERGDENMLKLLEYLESKNQSIIDKGDEN